MLFFEIEIGLANFIQLARSPTAAKAAIMIHVNLNIPSLEVMHVPVPVGFQSPSAI